MVAAAVTLPAAADGRVPLPHPAKAYAGQQCVEPVDVMRRFHMQYLMHQRDDTVHGGIRGTKYSLKGCVECHAVASPGVADGKVRTLQPFCKECHSYAAVTIDCFGCHTGAAK
ncbi:MAG: Hdr-like menaquinol oxidoreductase cytochrome c subunit [Hyphomicrobiales bacterium]|nr:Hdr-like menaquinol oxidoreductase cytochrome c subunit [Hyphomicrobiales bacterium]MCP5374348.1 Hdr-like menaquinol oxidoreductase cytochrome c subunit [Hyphomicrobiales bacterium]